MRAVAPAVVVVAALAAGAAFLLRERGGSGGPAPEPPLEGPSERDKIEGLLKAIEGSGLVFLRNGSGNDGPAASAHLRRKLDAAGDRVRTAEEFIDGVATKSSMSGEPYQVRLADGTVVDLSSWLRGRLGH